MASSATITAQASGYTTGTATMKTYIVDQASLNVTVTANPSTVVSGNKTTVTAFITYLGGIPATGATVQFTSSNGGTFTTVTDQGNGNYISTFTVPNFNIKTNCTITATVSKTDYTTSHANTQITIISTVNVGTMQLRIEDEDRQPLSDAVVSMLSQPSGMNTLVDITNSTGYVNFPNAIEGSYIISVNKLGYNQINQTIDFKTNTPLLTLALTKTADNQPLPDLTIVWLILVAVIIVVVVVVLAYRQKRKTAAKFKVPQKWTPPPPPKPRT
jgi:hypothetical protein